MAVLGKQHASSTKQCSNSAPISHLWAGETMKSISFFSKSFKTTQPLNFIINWTGTNPYKYGCPLTGLPALVLEQQWEQDS